MAYVPKYNYDVFISYAWADDGAFNGIISHFLIELERQLRARLDRDRDLEIYFDRREIKSGEPMTDQVLSAVRSSAVMIAFHSKAYEASEQWCMREYHEFTRDAPHLEASQLAGRIQIISLGTLSPDKSKLLGMKDLLYRSFFYEMNGNYHPFRPDSTETNSDQRTMSQEIDVIASEIAGNLENMRDEAKVKQVFVGACSERWWRQRDRIKSTLHSEGYHVHMQSPWGSEPEALDKEAAREIAACDAFVGIAEPDCPDDSSWQLGKRQLKIAETAGLGTAKKIHLWLPDSGISQSDLNVLAAREHVIGGLLLNNFITQVRDTVGSPEISAGQEKSASGNPGGGFLFVVANKVDTAGADVVWNFAGSQGAGRNVWIEAEEDDWMPNLKQAIEREQNVTGVVFVDGNCEKDWIEDRLRGFDAMRRDLAHDPGLGYAVFQPLPKTPTRYFRPPNTVEATYDNLSPLTDLLP